MMRAMAIALMLLLTALALASIIATLAERFA